MFPPNRALPGDLRPVSRCVFTRMGLKKSRLFRKCFSAWFSQVGGAWQITSCTCIDTCLSEMVTKSSRLCLPPFLGHMSLRWTPKPFRRTWDERQERRFTIRRWNHQIYSISYFLVQIITNNQSNINILTFHSVSVLLLLCHSEAESVQTEHVQNTSSPSPGWCRRLWSAERCVQRRRRSSAGSSTESRCLAGSVAAWSLRDKNQKQRLWRHRETWCRLLLLSLLSPPPPPFLSVNLNQTRTRTQHGTGFCLWTRWPELQVRQTPEGSDAHIYHLVGVSVCIQHVGRMKLERSLHVVTCLQDKLSTQVSSDKTCITPAIYTRPPSLFFFYRLKHAGEDKQKHV